MVKALREAKVSTSWASINEPYEEAVRQFVRSILEPRPGNLFLADLSTTVERIARFGLLNSLSQTLCKLAAPGVPDIYQGTELWDFSLVDPDNRRPVDYETRQRLLREIGPPQEKVTAAAAPATAAAAARALADSLSDGRAKLLLTRRALELRRANPDLFAHGAYVPLRVAGAHSAHLIAFMRRRNGSAAIALAPRLYWRLRQRAGDKELWGDTRIELPRRLRLDALVNVLDGATVKVHDAGGRRVLAAGEVLSSFPVALLTNNENA
jgi:(1->4)-alpha-D-glucan 1-alpha-D-glucosylmutase